MNELILGLNVANWILKKYKDTKLKIVLKKELSPYIDNFDRAYSEFTESYYRVVGAVAVCRFFKPLIRGNEKAIEYIENLKTSYSNFNKTLVELMDQIRIHRDRIKKYLSEKDMMMIDILLESLKDNEYDLKKLYGSNVVMTTFLKSAIKPNSFENKLNRGLQNFVKEENISMGQPSKQTMKDLNKILATAYTNPMRLEQALRKIAKEL